MSPIFLLFLLLSIVLVLFGVAAGVRSVVRFAKWRVGRCQWCGYDLGERSELRCPECGLNEDVRSRRAKMRLAQRLAIHSALPMAFGLFVVGSLGPHLIGPVVWTAMPNGMLIRFSFGDSASPDAREELAQRIWPVPTGSGGVAGLFHRFPLDPTALTPKQWERIATAILEDLERIDARSPNMLQQGLLPYADWLLHIPADAERIRDRVAELYEHGGDWGQKSAFWLIYGDDSTFADPRRWTMDDRLCPLLVERMLNDPQYYGCQSTSTLFASLCRCHWESIERYLREGSDEMHALPNQHPTRFTSSFSVRTPEDVQGLFLFVERMLDDEDPAMLRHREHFERSYRVLRRGQFGQIVYVNGVMQDGRWSFVPQTRAELDGEGGEGSGGDGGGGR